MSAQERPRGWPLLKREQLLLVVVLLGLTLDLVHQQRGYVALSRENIKLSEERRRVARFIRSELIWVLEDRQRSGLRYANRDEDYIEAEKWVRQNHGILLSQLPDREELLRRMKHEHDTGAWAPGRIKETVKND